MIGVYFSGTGNTKYCLKKFISFFDSNAEITSIEDIHILDKIAEHKDIILAYPIYYSNLPKIVQDFIEKNPTIWKGKNVFIIATMGLFSGDGTGVSARLFKKHGANILGGLHLKMPDCICDVKALKRTHIQNQKIIANTNKKIELAVNNLKKGTPPKNGLGFFYHIAGLFGQRLWFYGKTSKYSDKIHIDADACIGCGNCISICPMKNLSLFHGRAVTENHCTLCYRCVNQCNKKAITILGKHVISQHYIHDYR